MCLAKQNLGHILDESLILLVYYRYSVPPVLIKMGIPIIVFIVLQAMYNIVDSMFVSRMPEILNLEETGEYVVNALTLAFPIQMQMAAYT